MGQKMVKQTRRSISVRGITYDTLRQYCDDSQRSMSDVIEELLGALFEKSGLQTAPKKALSKAAPKESKVAKQLANARSRKVTVSSRGHAVANRIARLPVASPEESEAIRKKYQIPTGDESTAVMGRPSPTPISKYMKKQREVAPAGKDHRSIRF